MGGTCKLPASLASPVALLSESGCVDMKDPTRAAPGLIPYGVATSFWSDGAEKHRFLALPDGATIAVGDDGHLELPVGSVAVKLFAVGAQWIETRLLMHTDDKKWIGYSYAWRADQSEADVLPDSINGTPTPIATGQSWYYPSRGDCFACHTPAAGVSLGLELRQLDIAFNYGNTRADQLRTLWHIGVLSQPLPKVAPLPDVNDAKASLESRARAILHVNCSFCHRPGSTNGDLDFRFDTPFQQIGACNIPADRGGNPGDARLVPGQPDHSVILQRMLQIGVDRMPPLASSIVDAKATQIIRDWISSLTSCQGP